MKNLMVFVWLLAGLTLSSCEDNEVPNFALVEGTYAGTFFRSSPTTKWAGSSVTITLKDGTFSGSSDSPKYPAICAGTYVVTGANAIEFTNTCAWTADFDWSFILDGRYEIDYRDDELVMIRSYDNQTYDTYRLKMEQ